MLFEFLNILQKIKFKSIKFLFKTIYENYLGLNNISNRGIGYIYSYTFKINNKKYTFIKVF
jgi:hypothetical protein